MDTKKTINWSSVFGISFIWFTTQYGGGFASGAQLKSFFLDYGVWALPISICTQGIIALFYWYVLKFARKHDVYNYATLNKKLYGAFGPKLEPILSFLYDFMNCFGMTLIVAIAFATGGSVLNNLTGIPMFACTLIIGVMIFVAAGFGSKVVRAVAKYLSIAIIVGLVAVFVPNIIVQWGDITRNLSTITAPSAKPLSLLGPALLSMIVYAAGQAGSGAGVYSPHAKILTNPEEAKPTMLVGWLVNASMMFMCILGLFAVIDTEDYAASSTPTMVLIEHGPGAKFFLPVLSILIILGAVSTAVNIISAIQIRIMAGVDKDFDPEKKATKKSLLVMLGLCLVGLGISQFGLLPLVSKGYSFTGYLGWVLVVAAYILHYILTKNDTKPSRFAATEE